MLHDLYYAKMELLRRYNIGLKEILKEILATQDVGIWILSADKEKLPIADYLIHQGILSEDAIYEIIGQFTGYPYLNENFGAFQIEYKTPDSLILTRGQEKRILIKDPFNDPLSNNISSFCEHNRSNRYPIYFTRVEIFDSLSALCNERLLQSKSYFKNQPKSKLNAESKGKSEFESSSLCTRKDSSMYTLSEQKPTPGVTLAEEDLLDLANQAPIVNWVNHILSEGIQKTASDIHLEALEDGFRVRYRIQGSLYDMFTTSNHLILPVTARIKVMGNMNITENRIPQDGRINFEIQNRKVDLRVSTLPTQFGESIVIRILDKTMVRLSLDDLGLSEEIKANLESYIRIPYGMFIVTGPTGSGKTTTLYSVLNRLNTLDRKILTIEDPVEYGLEGLVQMNINPKLGVTFAKGLRAFLRQDPDVILVGEIRDRETAEIATQTALTGHLVLSTLHTNDTPGTIVRLMDLEIEPYLIAASLECILAQRLIRCICNDCRESVSILEIEKSKTQQMKQFQEMKNAWIKFKGENSALKNDSTFFRGTGCEYCDGSGYMGRQGIFEWLVVTDSLRDFIVKKSDLSVIRKQAITDGMQPLVIDGMRAALAGHTSIDEILALASFDLS